MRVALGKFMIDWVALGEVYNGEYDPYDVHDKELIRFDVYRAGFEGWEVVDDGSYCTELPATTSSELLVKLSHTMLNRLHEAEQKGMSLKKACEVLSWVNPSWVENGMHTLRR